MSPRAARRGPSRRPAGRGRSRPPSRRRWLVAALLLAAVCLWWSDRLPFLRRHHLDTIVIHHSATPQMITGRPVDATAIDAMHARRGFLTVAGGRTYHIGYHYVILGDGTVQHGRPESARGAHARFVNDHALGICVIGDFSRTDNPDGAKGPAQPTPAQMRSLVRLCARLMHTYGISMNHVVRHCDVGQTECPGNRFPFDAFKKRLEREVMSDE